VIPPLNYAEPEAIPLHWIRCGQDEVTPFRWRHLAMSYRPEFDAGGIVDGVPNDAIGVAVLKPTVVGLVAAKMRVDHKAHRTDIAPPRYVPRARDQPRKVEPATRILAEVSNMGFLHAANRHRAYRGLPRFR
jgi:hypothetical protein